MSDDPSGKKGTGSSSGKSRRSESGNMPEGMRVVRKRRKKRGGSRQTLFLKKREILRDMQEGDGAVGVKEQVERLKSARKARDEGKPLEENWGGKKRRRGGRWVLLACFAIAIPILAIVTGFQLMKKEEPAPKDSPNLDFENPGGEREVYVPTGSLAWIISNSVEAYESALNILDRLNEADGGPLEPDLFRFGQKTADKIAVDGLGWAADFFTADPRDLNWTTGESGGTGFLILEGRRVDQTPFRCYFVKTAEGIRLDWEATSARSYIPVVDLVEKAPVHPVLVRGFLYKEPHFDTTSEPGSLYSWYLIRGPFLEEHIWAYVPAGSDLDKQILKVFRYGWVVLERKEEIRATLRLVKPQLGFRPNEFEIEEFVAEDWVLP